jgi:quinol monooxygenase YgiN
MLIVLGTIEIHPDDIDAAIKMANTMAAATMKEPGCIQYAFGQDSAQSNRFLLTERWESPEALAAHFSTPHMAEFQGAMRNLRIQHLTATRYDVQGETKLM